MDGNQALIDFIDKRLTKVETKIDTLDLKLSGIGKEFVNKEEYNKDMEALEKRLNKMDDWGVWFQRIVFAVLITALLGLVVGNRLGF